MDFRQDRHYSSHSTLISERERDVGESFHPHEANREIDAPYAANMVRQNNQVGYLRGNIISLPRREFLNFT